MATLSSKLKKERGLKKRRESRASNAPERLDKMKPTKSSLSGALLVKREGRSWIVLGEELNERWEINGKWVSTKLWRVLAAK